MAYGDGALFKNDLGTWTMFVTVDGRRYERTGKDKTAVRAKIADLRRQLATGEYEAPTAKHARYQRSKPLMAASLADPTDDRRLHDLYRMYDIAGRLLYVGVTNGGLRRFMEHSKDKTWWREVDSIKVEHAHCTRSVIERMERDAIVAESPLYNVAHNHGIAPQELPAPKIQHGSESPRRAAERRLINASNLPGHSKSAVLTNDTIKNGQIVIHPTYGIGEVISTFFDGCDICAEIRYDSVRVLHSHVKQANLRLAPT
ncbi:hypothetical protein [Ilumatobacter sp.]|uniref:hypothetical protein n=1 Tax=Ilumatobacter sp. TaxID=1967498 RepID=UPI0037538BD0